MEEKSIIYGSSPLGLIFILESRARELADCFNALVTARTWGEFRGMVSRNIYEFYLPESVHCQGPVGASVDDLSPFYIPDETPFTPNDVFTFDRLPSHPEIEMAEWMPDEVQGKFGRRFKYTAMDMNVPDGEGLALDESKTDEIVEALGSFGFQCQRDDELIMAATTSDYDPDEFDDPEE